MAQLRRLIMARSPWGYWPMNEGTGAPQDRSGNGRNLTAVNAATWVRTPLGWALSFDGSNDEYATGPAWPQDAYSIEVVTWGTSPSASADSLFGFDNGHAQPRFETEQSLYLGRTNTSSLGTGPSVLAHRPNYAWHIGFIHPAGGVTTQYVNGHAVYTHTAATNSAANDGVRFGCAYGVSSSQEFGQVTMLQVAFYTSILTPTDMALRAKALAPFMSQARPAAA